MVTVAIRYFEWNPWFILFGQAIYFLGVHLTFQKAFPWFVAFLCGLLVNICSNLFFLYPGWFTISLLTILASSTYVSHKLDNPELSFKILFSSVISASLALLSLLWLNPIENNSHSAFTFFTILTVFAFIATTVNTAGIFLSLFIPRKSEK